MSIVKIEFEASNNQAPVSPRDEAQDFIPPLMSDKKSKIQIQNKLTCIAGYCGKTC